METPQLWDIEVTRISHDKPQKLGDYAKDKKLIMFVNVASACGLTESNYSQLKKIYDTYRHHGLEILGFPCNQFGAQEPKSEVEILQFVCESYSADFPIFEKIEVNGPNTHPVYQFLKSQGRNPIDGELITEIPWNFAKFLVNSKGNVEQYVDSESEPDTMIPAIESLLAQ